MTRLENGEKYRSLIQQSVGQGPGFRSEVVRVELGEKLTKEHGTASVTYSLFFGGQDALRNGTGLAVKIRGSWLVSAKTFCGLLELRGQRCP